MRDQIWSRGVVGNSSSAFIQNLHREERFRATQMRSSQSHPRTFELGLKQLKIRRVRKCLLMDRGLQPATRINNQISNETYCFPTERRRRGRKRGHCATWPVVRNPYECRDAKPYPPPPDPGGLAQPWRSSPGPPGSPLPHEPGYRSDIDWQECVVKKLAWINSSDDVCSGGSASVRARIQHAQIGSERPCSRD
jgi:hypothetical protein